MYPFTEIGTFYCEAFLCWKLYYTCLNFLEFGYLILDLLFHFHGPIIQLVASL